jgi:hypothetical protein
VHESAPSPLTRAALVAVSIAALLWLGANLVSRHEADAGATALAESAAAGLSPPALERAREHFDRARRFRGDAEVLLKEGSTLLFLKSHRRARAPLAQAVRLEPENATAWLLLFVAAGADDPQGAAVARRRALELDPRARAALSRVRPR